MPIQPVIYRGRVVAACTAERFLLCDELERCGPEDPERTFVIWMCVYAGDVARGVLPGPYRDLDARRYARAALIPSELLERPPLDAARTAVAIGIPVEEFCAARRDQRKRRFGAGPNPDLTGR